MVALFRERISNSMLIVLLFVFLHLIRYSHEYLSLHLPHFNIPYSTTLVSYRIRSVCAELGLQLACQDFITFSAEPEEESLFATHSMLFMHISWAFLASAFGTVKAMQI